LLPKLVLRDVPGKLVQRPRHPRRRWLHRRRPRCAALGDPPRHEV